MAVTEADARRSVREREAPPVQVPAPGSEPESPARRAGHLPYFPGLDGLRGSAVLVVLLFHSGFGWARGGFLGVSTFFTLSGFLITSLLLDERRASGDVDLKAFWIRRFRRLMPAALACLALVAVFGLVVADGAQKRNLAGDVLSALGYVANWRFVLSGQSYADLFAAPSPVLHFWSLAIEEQFYLVYPLLAYGVFRLAGFRRRYFAAVLGALTAASVAASFAGWSPDRIYYGTDTRAAELLLGGLLAVGLNYRRVTYRIATEPRLHLAVQIAGTAALALCALLWGITAQDSAWLHRGGFALCAALSAVVLTAALLPDGPVRAILAAPPLRYLGLISYGVYLYHWPVFLWLNEQRTGLEGGMLFALRTSVTIGVAVLSYRYVEMPVRRGEKLFGTRAVRLIPWVAGAVAASVIAITVTAPKPLIDFAAAQSELERATAELQGPTATSGPEAGGEAGGGALGSPPRPRIAVFGDSTAMLTAFGLRSYLVASGRADFAGGWTQLGCGISRFGDRRDVSDEGPVSDECNHWDSHWTEQLKTGQPNVAVIQVGPWEVVDRRLPGDRVWRSLGDPHYDDYLLGEMLHAVDVLSADGAQVMWLTLPPLGAPPGEDPLKFRGPGADPRRAERFNDLLRQLPALRPNRVRVIELADWLESTGEDERLRPDGVHFSDTTAYEVAERWLVDQLIEGYEQDWSARRREELAARADADLPDARVLWVGDSAALGFALGMHNYSKAEGGFVVGSISRIGCGIGRGGWRKNRDRQEPVPPNCEPFDTLYSREVAAVRPDLVFVMTGLWDVTDRKLPGDDVWRAPGDPVYDEYLRHEFIDASERLHEGGATVVWFTYPHIDLGKDETPPRSYPVNDPARIDRQNEIIRDVARDRPWIRVIDLAAHAETFPGGELDTWYRPDGVHFSATGAERLFREWLRGEVLGIYRDHLAGGGS